MNIAWIPGFNRFASWVIARAMRTPYSHLPNYMNRFWLFRLGTWGLADTDGTAATAREEGGRPFFAARVHQILRSDDARDPHDHPWPFLTIILRGGYKETRTRRDGATSDRWFPPGSVLFRRADDLHHLTLPAVDDADVANEEPAWTLFIMGPQIRKWGFWSLANGWTYWRTYLRGEPPVPQLPPFWAQVWAKIRGRS